MGVQVKFTANIRVARARRVLEESSNHLKKALTRLASGTRLVSLENDYTGLVVSWKFSAESACNRAVQNNLVNTLSYSQNQEGFFVGTTNALDCMGGIQSAGTGIQSGAAMVAQNKLHLIS